jgi:DNA-binding transcriptional MerR regulator
MVAGPKSATAFRTISEVSSELNLHQHVLRFWETKFNQVRPLKRGGGRRYYRPEDITLLRQIRGLLYDSGYTIKGVQKLMRDGNVKQKNTTKTPKANENIASNPVTNTTQNELHSILSELQQIQGILNN